MQTVNSIIDAFIVDFYSSDPSGIKISRGLGWGFFDILDTVNISTKNFEASLALEYFNEAYNIDAVILRNFDCSMITHHITFSDIDPYFNALIKIYDKCVYN